MPENVTAEEARLLQPAGTKPVTPALPRKDGETNRAYFERRKRINQQPVAAPEVHREEVSPKEYAERLARAQRRDNSLVSADKERRTTLALQGWKNTVGATFAEAHTERPDVLERVNRLVTGAGRHQTSLVFYGNYGTGKTWQAYAFIAEAMKRGALTPGQIIAGTETSIIGDIAAGGWQRTEKIRQLQEPRNQLYFIDEVGQGYFSREEARTEAWFGLINHIYNRQLTLLITTNLKPDANVLGNWLGVRTYDRLMSLLGGRNGFITLGNVNRRPDVAERNEQMYRSTVSNPGAARRPVS